MRDGIYRTDSGQAANNESQVFGIGKATLDLRARQLSFDGEAVDVQPKVFDLLAYLVMNRERVVSKDELFDEVWPSVVVSDASLSQTIKRARDIFRQQGFEQEIIRTVARRGYQFDHEVRLASKSTGESKGGAAERELEPRSKRGSATATALQESPKTDTPLASSRNIPLVAVGLIVLVALMVFWPETPQQDAGDSAGKLPQTAAPPAKNSETSNSAFRSSAKNRIVVLPFANLTADSDFGYFSDGLTETLINNLATVSGLQVISRRSSYIASQQENDLRSISTLLGVEHALQGSVQRSDDTLRISARLVNVSDGSQLWSHQYSRLMDNVFVVQDEIASAVVSELARVLDTSLGSPRKLAQVENAATAEAYRLMLRGVRERRRGTAESLLKAEGLFREAITLAPNFAEPLIRLAEAVRWQATSGGRPREPSFREALTLLQKAVEMAPKNGLAHWYLAEIQYLHFWDFTGADASFRRALEFSPGSADIYSAYSRYLAKIGDHKEAVTAAREAMSMDPRSTNVHTNLILRLIKARELNAARDAIEALKKIDESHIDIPWLETNWHLRAGSNREALQWISLEELDHLRLCLSAVALQRLERIGQAEDALSELIETDAKGSAFQIAETYAQWGDSTQAFVWLEQALSNGDPGLAELYSSLNLENLYGDPRFDSIANRIGLPPARDFSVSQ